MSYTYQRLSEDNLADFHTLYNEVFKKKATLQYLQKKYNTEYTGLKYVGYLAYDEETPIAFYGGLPQLFSINGRVIKAVHACDSITLPRYHRKGLHTNLALRSYQLMKKSDVKFVYAMHSYNTLRATKKLGWKLGESMVRYHYKVSTLPVSRAIYHIKKLNRYYLSLISRQLKKYKRLDEMKNPLINEGFLAQHYSKDYFEYKNFSFNELVEIDGVELWLKFRSKIHIGAFQSDSVDSLKKALSELSSLAKRVGIQEIQFHVSKNSIQDKQLGQIFEANESWSLGFLDFDQTIDYQKLKLNYGDHDTF